MQIKQNTEWTDCRCLNNLIWQVSEHVTTKTSFKLNDAVNRYRREESRLFQFNGALFIAMPIITNIHNTRN